MTGPGIAVVDPHIHLWDLSTGLYPRRRRAVEADGKPASAGDYSLADLAADASGIAVAKAVHVEAFPTDGLAEALHVQAMADGSASGLPQGIVASADLADPAADGHLASLAAIPNVRGIRQAMYFYRDRETRDHLSDPAWLKGFSLLARHGLSFDLQIGPHQADTAAGVMADHPETAVALNHVCLWEERGLDGWRRWHKALLLLAACPNVTIKVSGLAMFDPHWTVESFRPYVLEALDAFGIGRAMLASNFPVDKAWASYPAIWEAFAAIVSDLPANEQAALFAGNAERFYRI